MSDLATFLCVLLTVCLVVYALWLDFDDDF